MSYLHSQRLALIGDEFQGVRAAIEHAIEHWGHIHRQKAFAQANVKISQMLLVRQSASDTYVVRAFSVFEDIFRQEIHARGQRVPYKAEDLINKTARLSRIPDPIRLAAHSVREYRNIIVHHGSQANASPAFNDAVASLNTFLYAL